MLSVIKAEIKKNFKSGVIVVWILGLMISYISVGIFKLPETYADLFYKYFGLAPIMGLIMFMMFSGSFILEYTSNMEGLIKATENGKKQLVISKFIASGISASIVNLSILYTIAFKAFSAFKFENLDMPLKELWYFGNSGSNITVIQMIFIMTLTIIIGSFFLAAIGLFLSSVSKNAIIPFLLGGGFMAYSYFLEGRGLAKPSIFNIPIFGMYSSLLVRYNFPLSSWLLFIIMSIIGTGILYELSKRNFLKEI